MRKYLIFLAFFLSLIIEANALGPAIVITLPLIGTIKIAVGTLIAAIIGTIGAIMGFATFIMFIFEEALQTKSMGVWVLISNKLWDDAEEALKDYESNIDEVAWIVHHVGWLSPLSWKAFKFYVKGSRRQAESFRKAIERKREGLAKEPEPVTWEEVKRKLKKDVARKFKGRTVTFAEVERIYVDYPAEYRLIALKTIEEIVKEHNEKVKKT